MTAPKTFEVVIEKVYEIHADSLEEAQALVDKGDFGLFYGNCVQTDVISVFEVQP